MEVEPEQEIKVFMQYNKVVYTPGQKAQLPEMTEKDPVLDKAVLYLTGKLTLEQAQKEAAEAKAAKEAAKTKKAASKKETQGKKSAPKAAPQKQAPEQDKK